MCSGASIKLFLVDGTPSGMVTAGIGQWTGQALVVPRSRIDGFGRRPEAQRAGVYVLVGPDPAKEDRELVYIGEGEQVLSRLKEHLRNKDFWTKACVFTSSDGSLTKAHVKYLESRLIQLGEESKRSSLDNGKASELPRLPEADVSDMEQFLERVQVLLPVLGIHFTRPRPETLAVSGDKARTAFTFTVKGAGARAVEADDEFVVLRDSRASAKRANSWDTYQDLHKQLMDEGALVPDQQNPDLLVFTKDVAFSSPSAAGAIVSASNVSGRAVWKVEGTGQSYGDWQDAKLSASEAEAPNVEQPTAEPLPTA